MKKQGQVKKTLKQNRRTETSLKKCIENIDALEMENYTMREQVQELAKSLDEYKSIMTELHALTDLENYESQPRVKELLTQLSELLTAAADRMVNIAEYDEGDNQTMAGQTNNEGGHEEMEKMESSVVTASKNAASTMSGGHEWGRKKTTRFIQMKLGRRSPSIQKTKGHHPAYVMLRKVLSKNPNKLKDMMPRKMLLRVIYQVY